ncbi:hypothetical protein Tco_0905565 [Tanacetum coccineum]
MIYWRVRELWLNPGQKQNSRKPLIISYEGASGDFTGCTDQPEPLRLKGKLILLLRASNLRIRTVVYDYMVYKSCKAHLDPVDKDLQQTSFLNYIVSKYHVDFDVPNNDGRTPLRWFETQIDKLYAENKTQQKAFEDEIERATIHAQQQISVDELKYTEALYVSLEMCVYHKLPALVRCYCVALIY